MGTGGSEIYWTHTPDRKAAFASLISDMLGRKQKENDDQVESIAGVLKALPRERWADYVSNLPADVRANFEKKYGGVANVPLSYGEENKVKTDQLNAHDLQSVENSQNGGGPYTPDSISVGRLNPDLAGKAPWMGAAGQRNTYTDAASPTPQLPAAVNTAQQTADNVIPTGQENWTNTNVTLPQSKATIAHTTALTAHTNAETNKTNADTANVNARTKQINAYLGDENGPSPMVAQYVNAVRAAVAQGIGPDVVLKRIKDKKLSDAVNAELTKPENQDIMGHSPLTPNGAKALAELDPVEKQVDTIIALLEPHKDNNMGGLRAATIAYKLGFAADDPSEIAGQISRLNLGQIQAIMPFATKSRNYQYIKDIKQHTWDTSKDTFKNMYDKAIIIKQNFANMRAAINRYERVGATGDAPAGATPQSDVITTPDGLKWKKNPDGSMTQVQ